MKDILKEDLMKEVKNIIHTKEIIQERMKEAGHTKGMKIITDQEHIQIIRDIIILHGLLQDTIHREVTVLHHTEALHLRLDLPGAAEEAAEAETAVQAGDN